MESAENSKATNETEQVNSELMDVDDSIEQALDKMNINTQEVAENCANDDDKVQVCEDVEKTSPVSVDMKEDALSSPAENNQQENIPAIVDKIFHYAGAHVVPLSEVTIYPDHKRSTLKVRCKGCFSPFTLTEFQHHVCNERNQQI